MSARTYLEKLAMGAPPPPPLGAGAKAVHHMLTPGAGVKANALKAFKPIAPPQSFSHQFGPAAKLAALRRKCTCGGKGTCVSCGGTARAANAPDRSEGYGLKEVNSVEADEKMQEYGHGQPRDGKKKHAGIFQNTAERMLRRRAPLHGWRTALGLTAGAGFGSALGASHGWNEGQRAVDQALRNRQYRTAIFHEFGKPFNALAHGAAGGSVGMMGGTTLGLLAEQRAAALHSGRVNDLTNALRAGTAAGALGGSYAAYRHFREPKR